MTTRRRSRRLITTILLVAVALVLATAAIIPHMLHPLVVSLIANGTTRSLNGPRSFSASDDPDVQELEGLGVSTQLRVETGHEAISLRSWVMEPQDSPRGTIIVAHGIHDDMRAQLGTGRMLTDAGYRAVLVDLRGHVRSEGAWLSYGVHEAQDLVTLVDELDSRGLVTGEIGAVGTSYGGATVIQWAALDDRIRSVVAISAFANLREVVPRYVRIKVPVLWRLIPASWVDEGVDEAGRLADFDPDDASPLVAITHTDARVLLIHITEDDNIPCEHSERMHEAVRGHSELILLEGVDHYSVPLGTDEELDHVVVDWLAPQS